MRRILTTLLTLVLAGGSTAAQGGPWRVGRPLPHVHLPAIRNGSEIDLGDYRGRKLLLIEFASW